MSAYVHAEDRARLLFRLGRCGGELDPARLATPSDQDLGLDDDLAPQLLGGCSRLIRRRGETTFRHRDAEAPEELLPLMLVQVQGGRECTEPECVAGRVRACSGE